MSTTGGTFSDSIDDACKIGQLYMDEENLVDFNVEKWLGDRNDIVVTFLKAAAGMDSFHYRKKALALVSAVDSLYKARYVGLVTPLPFSKNLINYHISGTKII